MERITPDQIERVLLEEEENIARAKARQMQMLQIADAMQLPTADGCKSLAEWAAGRLDISVETARSLTSTSRRLEDLPDLSRDLADGAVTFDRAQATSRIPLEVQDDSLFYLDIQGLRRRAAHYRRLTKVDEQEAHVSQHLAIQPNLDESQWNLWGTLDGYAGSVVTKVLTEEADTISEMPDGTQPGLGYRTAVALVKVCEERHPGSIATPLITVFVDDKSAETQTGTSVGPGLLDKIACTGSLEIIKTVEGEPLSVGRRSRIISNRLKRFVLHRDGGCTAEGCTSRYRLEPHHKIPWSEGGSTDADQLTTLCWFHHHIVIHGWGYRIDVSRGAGRVRFIRPNHDPPRPDW